MSEELTIIPRETALAVLTDTQKFDAFYDRVKKETDAHVADVTTEKGRDAIKSLAFRVVKSKTAIDKAGQLLTEEWRTQTKKVDEARKSIRDKLDALRDEVRKPLTDWETAEKEREAAVAAGFDMLRQMRVVPIDATSGQIADVISHVSRLVFPEATFREGLSIVLAQRDDILEHLTTTYNRVVQSEKDAAELAQMRAEKEEREELEAQQRETERLTEQRRQYVNALINHIRELGEGRIGGQSYPYVILFRELDEKIDFSEFGEREPEARQLASDIRAKLEASLARERADREQADREAEKQRLAEAAEAAQRETERKATEALAAAEQAHQAELKAAQAERDQLAQAEKDRIAKMAADEADQNRRNADRAHKSAIMGAAKTALIAVMPADLPYSDEIAISIVRAIVAGEIPNVALTF